MTKYDGEMPWNGIDGNPVEPVIVETIPPTSPKNTWSGQVIFDHNPNSNNNVFLGEEANCYEEVIVLLTLEDYLFFKPGTVARTLIDRYLQG